MYDILQLNDKLVSELKEIAQRVGVKGYNKMNKQELVYKILDEQALAEKNSSNQDVPVVDEPNPQTGRRPRKVVRMGADNVEKPIEPTEEEAPKQENPSFRKERPLDDRRPGRPNERPVRTDRPPVQESENRQVPSSDQPEQPRGREPQLPPRNRPQQQQ